MLRSLAAAAGFGVLLAMAVPAHAHEVYVTNEKDNTISVIDSKSLELVRTIKVGKRPRGITFSRDFKRFYVCASDDNAVQVYDTETGALLHDLPSGADPEQFALTHDARSWRRSRSASSPRAWRSRRTTSTPSRRRKPPTWRI